MINAGCEELNSQQRSSEINFLEGSYEYCCGQSVGIYRQARAYHHDQFLSQAIG